jgi:SPP1 family predicted phage head-tail adaptor
MRAGQLRSQVHIERRGTSRDTWGQETERWLPFAVVRADVRFPSGMGIISGEREEGGREVSVVQCSIRIRWRNDITSEMRVRMQVAGTTTYFEIKQVVPDIRSRQFVDLVCAMGTIQE